MSRHQNATQNQNLAKCEYLETIITDQNYIHEGIKNRLKSIKTCYHSVQNFL